MYSGVQFTGLIFRSAKKHAVSVYALNGTLFLIVYVINRVIPEDYKNGINGVPYIFFPGQGLPFKMLNKFQKKYILIIVNELYIYFYNKC